MCQDGIDNDSDGDPDCADTDCLPQPACGGAGGGEICADSLDNDADGLTDCSDPDCTGDLACP